MNATNENPIEYVDPPERSEIPTDPVVKEKPEPPKLNRAQCRGLAKYIRIQARSQVRKAMRRVPDVIEMQGPRCARCNLLFIGRASWRCQCKIVPAGKENHE